MSKTQTAPVEPETAVTAAPRIRRLTVDRFRGIEKLCWYPFDGVNLILGGGDAGKTTILDAIALLLSPTNAASPADTDYHLRRIEDEFLIEAVMTLPQEGAINSQPKPSWPWDWNGSEPVVPNADDEGAAASRPVYRLRVRGTSELELVYEILQPDGTTDHLSVGLRRAIGLVRLSGDDRNDRDLRLVQGSGLDRLLSDKSLRSRMARELAKTEVEGQLSPEGAASLARLDEVFRGQGLPETLRLSITGGQGASIAALVGLTAANQEIQLPLANWGTGTRRLAGLTISEQTQGEAPIVVVDEVERGLEPYRQLELMRRLQNGESQVFATTHSPATIAAGSLATFWYVDHRGRIGPLDGMRIAKHRAGDPNAFLARLAIVVEGKTEVGFVSALLEAALESPLAQCGVYVSDGGGHENTLNVLEALCGGGVQFAGFADDEGKFPDRWKRLETKLGPLLFRWRSGCIERNLIEALPVEGLEQLIIDPAGEDTGSRLRTLADRLGMTGELDFALVAAEAGTQLKRVIIEAATGFVPDDKADQKKVYKNHAQIWFKSISGGRELADKVFGLGLWPRFREQLLPFCNAVREALGMPPVTDVTR